MGTWYLRLSPSGDGSQYAGRKASLNGTIYHDSATRMSDIRDGTSNTIVMGEHGHSYLASAVIDDYHLWNSGFHQDTMFEAFYPMNPHRQSLPCAQQHLPASGFQLSSWRRNVRLCGWIGSVPQGFD